VKVFEPFGSQAQEIAMSRITQSLLAGALAVLVNAVIAVSLAATPDATVSRSLTVRYGDLSLDRPADIALLYHRIGVAAENVCGPRKDTGSPFELPQYRTCFDAAVSSAVAAVASPALSAYYRTQLPRSHVPATTLAQR
jgi:UrcA family protein